MDNRRFLPEHVGELVLVLPFEDLGDLFLLSYSADFPEVVETPPAQNVSPPVQDDAPPDWEGQAPPPMWPHAPSPDFYCEPDFPCELNFPCEPGFPCENEVSAPPAVPEIPLWANTICNSLGEYIPFLPRRPRIALTFDDGPSRFTEMIMDTLEIYGGRVTFCVMGYRVAEWEDTIRRAHENGHEVMGHSWNHANMTQQNRAGITAAIQQTDDAIYAITGTRTHLFRPPYGAINTLVETVASELGYGILLWSIDPQDWRAENRNAQHIYRWITDRATDGAIVVLHDVFASNAQAMEMVIPRLIADGFELVTVSEIIHEHYGVIVPGFTYRGLR